MIANSSDWPATFVVAVALLCTAAIVIAGIRRDR